MQNEKLNDTIMQQQAHLCVQNCPNDSWRDRGALTMVGPTEQHPVHKYNLNHETLLGIATVATFHFEKPPKKEPDSTFRGFVLAVMETNKKLLVASGAICGVSSFSREYSLGTPLSELAGHFCPKCGKIDTVKSRSRVIGPELVKVTYYCKCGYKDVDMID